MQTVALLEEYACERFGAAAVETVDGDTPAAARHDAVQRFNAPGDGGRAAGFLFLGATRCCGLGTNLPTVSSVVLFDSDWDARADIQVWGCLRPYPSSVACCGCSHDDKGYKGIEVATDPSICRNSRDTVHMEIRAPP